MIPEQYKDYPDPQTTPTAGFLPRLGAAIVDLFVLAPLSYAIYYFMVIQPSLAAVGAISLLQALYKPLGEAFYGRTVGKAIMKIWVVDRRTLGKITLNQSFVRYLPWAVAAFASIFVLIRVSEAADFKEVGSMQEYVNYLAGFPLSQNFFVSLCNNFPIFSAVWMIMDPWNRALHDRWAETFVLRKEAVTSLN